MGFSLGLGPASPREAGRRGIRRPRAEGWPGGERVAVRVAGGGPAPPGGAGGRGIRRPRAEVWPGDERVALRFAAGEPGSLALLVRHFAEELFPLAARLAGAEHGEGLLEG